MLRHLTSTALAILISTAAVQATANEGWIGDPENPANQGGDSTSDEAGQAQPRAGLSCAPYPAISTVPPPLFRGTYEARLSSNFRRLHETQETLALEQAVRARLRHRLDSGWTATLEGILRLSLYGRGDEAKAPIVITPSGIRGEWETELGVATMSRQRGGWIITLGNQHIRWGVSDLLSPADIINPRDYRRGLMAQGDDSRLPIPAANVIYATERFSAQLVVLPVFVPNRYPLLGTRQAMLRPALEFGLPAGLSAGLDRVLDPSVLGQAEQLLAGTKRPQPLPANISAGGRLTLTTPGQDLSIGALYGWDRMPSLKTADNWEELVEVLAEPPSTPLGLLPLAGLLDDPGSIFQTSYERRLWLVADGVRTIGPVGVRAEAVYSPLATSLLQGGVTVRRPSAQGLIGLSWERDAENFLATVEFISQRSFPRASDPAPLLFEDPMRAVAAGIRVKPSAIAAFDGSAASEWTLTLGGLALVPQGDTMLNGELVWDLHSRHQLAISATGIVSLGRSGGLATKAKALSHGMLRYQAIF